jgi:uncharacterized lipoprotein
MHNSTMKRSLLLFAFAIPVALGGCQTIKSHNPFRHRAPDYQNAQQERPLEVPPGLDQPATSNALAIPGEAGGSTAQATATSAAPPPAALGEAAPGEAAGATTTRTLALADTPDSAYRRVGLALQRGDAGQVTAQDAAAHTYTVAVDTVVVEKSKGGFLHRMFHRSHKRTVHGVATLSVAAEGAGSVISATGDADAVTRVIAVLQRRLK